MQGLLRGYLHSWVAKGKKMACAASLNVSLPKVVMVLEMLAFYEDLESSKN